MDKYIFNHGLDMIATTNRIAQYINESCFTEAQIANSIGVTPQAVNKWSHGSLPSLENIALLGLLLGISINDFLVYKPNNALVKRMWAYYVRLSRAYSKPYSKPQVEFCIDFS